MSVMIPLEVDRTAMPSPLRTRGIFSTSVYFRRPGVDTRSIFLMAGVLVWGCYFKAILMVLNGSPSTSL